MPLSFRRSVKLFPGVRLNFSKSGVSTSVGVKGAHITLGRDRVTQTVDISGTGLGYSSTSRRTETAAPAARRSIWSLIGLVALLLAIVCFSGGLKNAGFASLLIGFVMVGVAFLLRRQEAASNASGLEKP